MLRICISYKSPSDVYGADYVVYLKGLAEPQIQGTLVQERVEARKPKVWEKISVLKKVVFFLKSNQQGLKRWVNERRT